MGTIHTIVKDSNDVVLAEYETTLQDATLTMVINYFAASQGYSATVLDEEGADIANPETKGSFLLRKQREHIVNVVTSYAANAAADAARNQVLANKVVL